MGGIPGRGKGHAVTAFFSSEIIAAQRAAHKTDIVQQYRAFLRTGTQLCIDADAPVTFDLSIRMPGWIGMGVVVAINVWLVIRGFLAVNRRRTAEKNANRTANLQAMQEEQERKAAEEQATLDSDTIPPEEK